MPYARLYLGLTLVNADKYAEARDVLRAYVRDYPQSRSLPDALYRAGECSYLARRFEVGRTRVGPVREGLSAARTGRMGPALPGRQRAAAEGAGRRSRRHSKRRSSGFPRADWPTIPGSASRGPTRISIKIARRGEMYARTGRRQEQSAGSAGADEPGDHSLSRRGNSKRRRRRSCGWRRNFPSRRWSARPI